MNPNESSSRPILILGAAGQVGRALQRDLAATGPVIALDLPDIDITDEGSVGQLVDRIRPRTIVNAAAYTAVDKAESDPDAAQRVNGIAVGILAKASRRVGALFVHYSTEYVFDGTKSSAYLPTDTPNPVSAYGRSKLAGEQALFDTGGASILIRTSWVFSLHGGNFVKTILRLAREREQLRVVADQVGQPTPAELISSVTALMLYRLEIERTQIDAPRVYHLASSRPVTWHEFARTIVERALASGFELRANADGVAPIGTADYPLPAKRPANSRLDVSLLERDFGLRLPDWLPYLNRMLEDLKRGEKG